VYFIGIFSIKKPGIFFVIISLFPIHKPVKMKSYIKFLIFILTLTILSCSKNSVSPKEIALSQAKNIVGTYVGQISVTSGGDYYNDTTHLWENYSIVDTVYNYTLIVSKSADTGFVVDKWTYVFGYDSASNYNASSAIGLYAFSRYVKYIYSSDSLYVTFGTFVESGHGHGGGTDTAFVGKKLR
jgi:hypothetical protein